MKFHSWEEIIKYFSDDPESQINLWRYVTAFRGPDNDDNHWKKILTCLLRGHCTDIALDITNTFSYVRNETSDQINVKLNATFEQIPIHYLYHTADGFVALSDYYCNEMKNAQLGDLFSKLSDRIRQYNISKIVSIVIEIVYIMHADQK